jgi:hypothetical protein
VDREGDVRSPTILRLRTRRCIIDVEWRPWRVWKRKRWGYEHGPTLFDHTFSFGLFSVWVHRF